MIRFGSTKWLTRTSLLAALSLILVYFVHFPIFPAAPFLEYDMADVPILIGTFMFGPVSGLLLTAVVSVLQWLLISPAGGWVGAAMHFFATGTFVLTAGLLYRGFHSRVGAAFGLAFGSIAMILVMIPLNYIFTVNFYGTPKEVLDQMIWPVLVPFNTVKAGANSVLTFLLYKSVSKLFKFERHHVKKTLQEKLGKRKLSPPFKPLYLILVTVMRLLYQKRLGLTIRREITLKNYKGPYIVVSNHASRYDYLYATMAFFPHTLNFVAGYNEFFRAHLAFIFRLMQVVPKRNFVPDTYAIRAVSRILKKGGRVILFPEGMSSISGANQPVAIGSGKFLKHFKVPVLKLQIAGGYLTTPKFSLDERPGKVEAAVSELFTAEQLDAMSAEEIQVKLDEALYHDDYAWNKIARVSFEAKGKTADRLHTLLFWCPKCGAEFAMKGEGNTLACSRCGNGATLNDKYDLTPLDESSVIPETPQKWFELQRKHIYRAVKAADFALHEQVRLGALPRYEYLKDQSTSKIVGEGTLTLDSTGFSYEGTRDGRPFSFHINPAQLPTFGMCTDISRFYTFVDGEFLEFFPEGETVEKWFLAAEEIHRLEGGAWRNFKDADTYGA